MRGESQLPERFESTLGEFIEKEKPIYTEKEIVLLRHLFPKLKEVSNEEIHRIFNINGKQLSIFAIISLRTLFPERSPIRLKEFLENEEELKAYIDEVPEFSEEKKRDFWQTFSILPLKDSVKKYIFQKFEEFPFSKTLTETYKESESDDEIFSRTSTLVNLPIAHLPRLKTYLSSSIEKERLEIPPAHLYIYRTDKLGNIVSLLESCVLTPAETSAAFAYARKLLSHINSDKYKKIFIEKYRKIKNLGEESEIDFEEVKEYFYYKIIEKWSKQILKEKFAREGKTFYEEPVRVELRFTQYRKQPPWQIREIISKSENLNLYFLSKTQNEETKKPPAMISLDGLTRAIENSQDVFEIFTLETSTPTKEKPSLPKIRIPQRVNSFNELQRDCLRIAYATKSGNWEEAVETYLKHLNYWPQYLAHRFGVIDILRKSEEGTIELPKKILSIASGPHEEFRAWLDVVNDYERIPEIVNLDITFKMLQLSKKELAEIKKLPPEVLSKAIDIVGDARALPFSKNSFDMIECSSFDSFTNEEIIEILIQSARVLKKGGVMRFATTKPFSEEFYEILRKNGITVLEKSSRFKLSPDIKKELQEKGESKLIERVENKLKRYFYFLAKIDREIDLEAFREELKKISIFEVRKSLTMREIKRMIERGIDEDILDINIYRAVTLNPHYFLERKKLKPEYLRFALQNLRGKIGFSDALKLYVIYFQDEKLSQYCDTVFEILSAFSRSREFFSLNLLMHNNEKVRSLFREYLLKHFSYYFRSFLESKLDEELKREIFHEASKKPETLKNLSLYLHEIANDRDKLLALAWVFRSLPPNTFLDLPVEMRFISELQDFYFRFSKEKLSRDTYTNSEVKRILASRLPEIILDEKILSLAFNMARKEGDQEFIEKFLSYIETENTQALRNFFEEYKEDLQKFLIQLKEDAKKNKDFERFFRIIKIEKKCLGISIDDKEKRTILEYITLEKYRELLEKYRRKRITKENRKNIKQNLIDEIDQLSKLLATKYDVSFLEIQMFLYSHEFSLLTSYPRSKKIYELIDTVTSHLRKSITDSLVSMEGLDFEKFSDIVLMIWSDRKYERLESITKDIIKKHPEIAKNPGFITKIISNLDNYRNLQQLLEYMIQTNLDTLLHSSIILIIRSEIDKLKQNLTLFPHRILEIAIKHIDFLTEQNQLNKEDADFLRYWKMIFKEKNLPLDMEELERIFSVYPQIIYSNECLFLIAKNIYHTNIRNFVLNHDEIIEKLFEKEWDILNIEIKRNPDIIATDIFLIFAKKISLEIKKMKEKLRINPDYEPHPSINYIIHYIKAKKENKIPQDLIEKIEELIPREDRRFFMAWYRISQMGELPKTYGGFKQLFETVPEFVLSKGIENLIEKLNTSFPVEDHIIKFVLDNKTIFLKLVGRYETLKDNENWLILIFLGIQRYPEITARHYFIEHIKPTINKIKNVLNNQIQSLKENPRLPLTPFLYAIIQQLIQFENQNFQETIISQDELRFLKAWQAFFINKSHIGLEEIDIFIQFAPNVFKDDGFRNFILKSILTDEAIRTHILFNLDNFPEEMREFLATQIPIYLLSGEKEIEIRGIRRKIEVGSALEFLNQIGSNKFPVIKITLLPNGNYIATIKIKTALTFEIFVPQTLMSEDLKRKFPKAIDRKLDLFLDQFPEFSNRVYLTLRENLKRPDSLVGSVYKE